MRLVTFDVVGKGEFPWHLLARESCWPVTHYDAWRMTEKGTRRVTLRFVVNGDRVKDYPFVPSWVQRGWSVDNIKVS